MFTQDFYNHIRNELISNQSSKILELEKHYTDVLVKFIFDNFFDIEEDFNTSFSLSPFWEAYAPIQRGYKPSGQAYPWGEVGEKVLEGYLYSGLSKIFDNFRFPGIPYGHDVRFITDEVFINIDIKSTGPTDNVNEVVVSPNQVTGDGIYTGHGIVNNNEVLMQGLRVGKLFRPELAPFYIMDGKAIPVLTFYVKVVYSVNVIGNQPLRYIEVVCVPNGLPMFVNPDYNLHFPGIFTPGKDEQ